MGTRGRRDPARERYIFKSESASLGARERSPFILPFCVGSSSHPGSRSAHIVDVGAFVTLARENVEDQVAELVNVGGQRYRSAVRVCGVDLTGSRANLVVLETGPSTTLVACNPRFVELSDPLDSASVRTFKTVFDVFVQDHAVERIAIKKRNQTGKFAGGAMTFKIEGLIQLSTIPVEFISPVTIASCFKKTDMKYPVDLRKYQEDAFRTAITCLESKP